VLTDAVQQALRDAADEQPFHPDLAGVPRRTRQLRRRRRAAISISAMTAIAIIAVAATFAATGGIDRIGSSPAGSSDAIIDMVDHWGPTRGSYADDPAFIERVKQEWLHPGGSYYGDPSRGGVEIQTNADGTKGVSPPNRLRQLTGDVQVLYADQTPDGPAAVVAQRSTRPEVGTYIAFLLPTDDKNFKLVAAYTAGLHAQREFGETGFDTDLITFVTTASDKHAVVLPADPGAAVSVSESHSTDATGHVSRTWAPVQTQDGVATLTAPQDLGFADTLIRVVRGGQTIDEAAITDVLLSPTVKPWMPANAVPDWTDYNGEIAGLHSGAGYPPGFYQSWLTRYGASDEPWSGGWGFEGQLPDRTGIFVEELWLFGDPAHTVVFRTHGKQTDIVSDTVTDPTQRPLVLMQLPDQQGWLFIGGPHTTIQGYRESDGQSWSDIDTTTSGTTDGVKDTTRGAAVIPFSADHIQVKLDVNGRKKIVDR
jgi:hypothetical protein